MMKMTAIHVALARALRAARALAAVRHPRAARRLLPAQVGMIVLVALKDVTGGKNLRDLPPAALMIASCMIPPEWFDVLSMSIDVSGCSFDFIDIPGCKALNGCCFHVQRAPQLCDSCSRAGQPKCMACLKEHLAFYKG